MMATTPTDNLDSTVKDRGDNDGSRPKLGSSALFGSDGPATEREFRSCCESNYDKSRLYAL